MRFRMSHVAVALALVFELTGLTVRAQQPPQANRPPAQAGPPPGFLNSGKAPDPAAVERGQRVYVATCGFCHGSSAKGGEGGPDLIRAVPVLRDEGGNLLGPIIQKGRQGMPAFPNMTMDQIKDISAFLRSRTQAAANRMSYKILNVVTGDAKAGANYFNQKCKSCHSPTGDLARVGNKYGEPANLQNRFLYPAGQGRGPMGGGGMRQPTLATVKEGGKTITGTLEYRDDFTLGVRNAEGIYQSFDVSRITYDLKDPYAEHERLLPLYTDKDMHDILAYLVTLK